METTSLTKENEEDWLYTNPGRTEVFQKWLDSLQKSNVRRAKVPPEKKLTYRNYATPYG
jgi:hypothetical protein